MTDINMLRAKLRKSMDNIGRNNGHACPDTKSNVDPVLHELYVAAEGQAYFKVRFDEAKAAALEVGEGLDKAVEGVIAMGAGTSVTLAEGDVYTLTADISKPAARLDQTKLRNLLQTEYGLTKANVDTAFAKCSTSNKPATKIRVASRHT